MTFTPFLTFDGEDRMGATAVFAFSLLSAIGLSLVILRFVWLLAVAYFKHTAVENLTREGFFFRSQLGQYAGCLLLANWFTSISGLLELHWAWNDGIAAGVSCNAQGVLSQIGEFGTAWFIAVMGIHTFITLVLRTHQPTWVGLATIVTGWVGAVLIATAPLSLNMWGPLYAPVTIDCGIGRNYPNPHIFLYFVPLFLSSLISTAIYSLIFLVLRGNITINGGLKFHMIPHDQHWRAVNSGVEQYKRFVTAVARSMLWFPGAFMICIIPNAIVQLVDTSGLQASSGGTAFTLVLRHSNGLIDVIVLYNVLRVLGPAFKDNSEDIEKRPSREIPPGSAFGPGFGRSFLEDYPAQNAQSQRPVGAPTRKPYMAHVRGNGSSDSTARLIGSELGHSRSRSSESGHSRIGSDSGHGRFVSKDMISKPMPMELPGSFDEANAINVPQPTYPTQPTHRRVLTAESVQHRDVSLNDLSEVLRGPSPIPTMPKAAMHKPLPLIPDTRKPNVPEAVPQEQESKPATRVPVPQMPRAVESRTITQSNQHHKSDGAQPPKRERVQPPKWEQLQRIQEDDSTASIASSPMSSPRDAEHEIVIQPFTPKGRTTSKDNTTSVINLYLSHTTTHETLPEFPTTANEFTFEHHPSRPAGEPRDFVDPAPPPRRRSPPLSRPNQPRPQPLEMPAPAPTSGPASPPMIVTAAVTEFDMAEYYIAPGPAPPVPPLPFASKPRPQPAQPVPTEYAPTIYAQTEVDMSDYYQSVEEELPGLPPLPSFRPRISVYDDDVTHGGLGLGKRPRESVRALPLPPHMRLDVSLSPVTLSVPSNVFASLQATFYPAAAPAPALAPASVAAPRKGWAPGTTAPVIRSPYRFEF
ncbi:hypothetical protein OF83DRAFT_1172884 [Amylostereum chailletii]|nr:hypothetical protein OF83DRAFT_1172884 [Amylostereum chailletii]